MKKLSFICCLLCFSLFSFTSFSQPRKNKNAVFVEFNFLANNLSLKYNRLLMLEDKSALGYSIGLNSMYKRTGFIVPPNIGFPIDINYLYGEKLSYVFIGVNATPQFVFSKDYTHFNKENLEVRIEENTNLIYIIPQIGVRSHINEIVDFKVSLGPRIKVVETNNEYIGRVFENNKYLEAFFLQLSLGFPF
tara:strand:+ start:44428 stop:45000 length:573 start_codon:yes stop_codon:yes gene_type:complete